MTNLSTTPWLTKDSEIITKLKASGYDVKTENGQTAICIGKTVYVVDLSKPLWTIMAEIGQIEAQNKKDEIKQEIADRAAQYHEQYEEKTEQIKVLNKRRSIFKREWDWARKQLHGILGKNKVDNVEELQEGKDKKLAVQYSTDATANKRRWWSTGSEIIYTAYDAVNLTLEEGRLNNFVVSA